MHLTLKKEATRPPGFNSLQQRGRFDAFVREFNAERLHQALGMKYPAELYTPSARSYDGLPAESQWFCGMRNGRIHPQFGVQRQTAIGLRKARRSIAICLQDLGWLSYFPA